MTAALALEEVRKLFGGRAVLDGLSLVVRTGERVALLGHNGAGKSTLLRVASGLLPFEAGRVIVAGLPIPARHREAKERIGYLPDVAPLYEVLTPLEYLEYIATLWRLPAAAARERAVAYLKEYQLWEARNSWIQTMSKGMRQKVGLISVLMREPQILMLDEPFSGLDAEAIDLTVRILRNLSDDRTLIVASHDLEPVEQVARRAVVLRQGRVIADFPVRPGRLAGDLQHAVRVAAGVSV